MSYSLLCHFRFFFVSSVYLFSSFSSSTASVPFPLFVALFFIICISLFVWPTRQSVVTSTSSRNLLLLLFLNFSNVYVVAAVEWFFFLLRLFTSDNVRKQWNQTFGWKYSQAFSSMDNEETCCLLIYWNLWVEMLQSLLPPPFASFFLCLQFYFLSFVCLFSIIIFGLVGFLFNCFILCFVFGFVCETFFHISSFLPFDRYLDELAKDKPN